MNNYQLGIFGETLAANYLCKHNYLIIKRNFRIGHKEFDLIAIHFKQTVFIEVKTRTNKNYGSAEDQLCHKKIELLKKAIHLYCQLFHVNPDMTRLDFIAIDLDIFKKTAKIKHFRNIF